MSDDGNVTPIRPGAWDPNIIADDQVVPPDQILEANKGKASCLVLAFLDDKGELHVCGSHSISDSHRLLHMAMFELIRPTGRATAP